MPEKRMFAKSIVGSDAFLDLKPSTRCLYFSFGMEADDDGFVGNPKAIMRKCGCNNDDFTELLNKRFILMFETGVIAIKHWRINNYLRKDRYLATTYQEEKAMLEFDEKGAYTEKGKNKSIKKDIWEETEKKYKQRYQKKSNDPEKPNYKEKAKSNIESES